MSDIVDEVGFECYQTQHGIWVKERPDGRRGPCVADEAALWQALQAAMGGKPQPAVDVAALVKENEQLAKECERLVAEKDDLHATCERLTQHLADAQRMLDEGDCIIHALREDNAALQANQRKKPGRKLRSRPDAGPAGGPEAFPAHEGDPLDEDL